MAKRDTSWIDEHPVIAAVAMFWDGDAADRADAVEVVEDWIEAHPEDLLGYVTLADFYDQRGRPVLARMHLDHCVALAPNRAACWYDRGRFLWKRERFEDAIPDFTRAAELDAGERSFEWRPQLLIADCLRRLHRPKQALDWLNRIPKDWVYRGWDGGDPMTRDGMIRLINWAPFRDGKD